MATSIWSMPRAQRRAMCSRVCGIVPLSAATTRRAIWIPPAPASILRMNFSWPGTSTNAISGSSGRGGRRANPRSIVIPRCCSSKKRSGFTPVRACTRVDLPWSICPAVPMMPCCAMAQILPGMMHQPVPQKALWFCCWLWFSSCHSLSVVKRTIRVNT